MEPPFAPDSLHLDTGAPLRTWTVSHAFDTARQCEEYHVYGWKHAKDAERHAKGVALAKAQDFNKSLEFSQCIASDDRRLGK
jgi:hypothetical protein